MILINQNISAFILSLNNQQKFINKKSLQVVMSLKQNRYLI